MSQPLLKPAFVFDFDNTLTDGDVLDEVIETFSPNDDWRTWEAEWAAGRLSARDCLRNQMANLRVTREALFRHLAAVRVDANFVPLLRGARKDGIPVLIVSDSFRPLIEHILACNGISGVPVFANELEFAGERVQPSFPFYDPAFPRSANAKARHLVAYRDHTVVFAGDGLSDLDAALASDIVFAKDTLAREFSHRGLPFRPFANLAPVLAFLDSIHEAVLAEPVARAS